MRKIIDINFKVKRLSCSHSYSPVNFQRPIDLEADISYLMTYRRWDGWWLMLWLCPFPGVQFQMCHIIYLSP